MPKPANPYFPGITADALSKPLGPAPTHVDTTPAPQEPAPVYDACIIITTSDPRPESLTYKFTSVSEALGNFERVQYEYRYLNRDRWQAEPDGVHFHNILVLSTIDPQSPDPLVRSARVVTPNGEWTDTVAHLWVTEGDPQWITTRGDYADGSQPVINYQYS